MSMNISIGVSSPPDDPSGFPGFLDGGIRISVDGRVLTRYKDPHKGFARYDVEGDPLEHTEQYVGEYLSLSLKQLRLATVKFQYGNFDRYEELSAKMISEPGDSVVVLSFCDGEHARIAFQPSAVRHGSNFSTEVTVGYAIDPDEMCHELADCYRDCVTFVENAYTDWEYGDLSEDIDDVHDWANEHIEELLDATSTDD